MRRRIDHLLLRRLLILAVGILLQACGCERAPDTDSPPSGPAADPAPTKAAPEPAPITTATKPGSEKIDAIDLIEGPITTFERACAGCHGPQGAFHDESLAKMTDDKLGEMVEQMMRGPGQLQPTPAQFEAMVAYQRSLRDQRPFICVTNGAAFLSGKDTILQGEATPGVAVSLSKGETVLKADSEQLRWSVPNAPRPPFTVLAVQGENTIRLTYPSQLWSE